MLILNAAHRRVVTILMLSFASLALTAGSAMAQETTGGADPDAAPSPTPAAETEQAPERTTARKVPKALRKGDRGANVRRLQRRLRITADGMFGPATKRTVQRYQSRKGIRPNGVAGPATLAKLRIKLLPVSDSNITLPRHIRRTLAKIAKCESGGNPRAIGGGGRYRGKYQFMRSTWKRLGGKGDPAKASEAMQDRIAAKLLRREGTKPWPSCGA